jgi:hypothetical protein
LEREGSRDLSIINVRESDAGARPPKMMDRAVTEEYQQRKEMGPSSQQFRHKSAFKTERLLNRKAELKWGFLTPKLAT